MWSTHWHKEEVEPLGAFDLDVSIQTGSSELHHLERDETEGSERFFIRMLNNEVDDVPRDGGEDG